MMKRFCNTDAVERLAMANCAMILNRAESARSSQTGQIFKCKTCQRSFATFQALGGHTASHKRPKLGGEGEVADTEAEKQLPKPHSCSVCSAQFWTGQALGGHMRKHRAAKIHQFLGSNGSSNIIINNNSSAVTSSDDGYDLDLKMGSNDSYGKRVLGLDLNLSPEANELKVFGF